MLYIFAGNETGAHLITSFMVRMKQNPECLEKVKKELNEKIYLDGKFNFENILENLNLEVIGDLSYLGMAVKECLRIDPPAPSSISYKAVQDTSLAGVPIKKDTIIWQGIAGIVKHPL